MIGMKCMLFGIFLGVKNQFGAGSSPGSPLFGAMKPTENVLVNITVDPFPNTVKLFLIMS